MEVAGTTVVGASVGVSTTENLSLDIWLETHAFTLKFHARGNILYVDVMKNSKCSE